MPPLRFAAPLLRGLLAGLTLSGPALASPATDLFQKASSLLLGEYYGWSTTDRPALVQQYRTVLDARCAPLGDTCDYSEGRAVVKDMLAQLHDEHTGIRDAEGAERLREVQEDLTVPRTGLRVTRTPLGLLVVGVLPGSPADTAGLHRFDLVTQVNGSVTAGDSADPIAFVRLERQGNPVTLRVQQPGQPPRDLNVPTAPLKARDVPVLGWRDVPGGRVAVIQYPTFLPGDSADLFRRALAQAQAGGAAALVVDLRANGGGRLDQCVQAASVFRPAYYQARTPQPGRPADTAPVTSTEYAAYDGQAMPGSSVRHLLDRPGGDLRGLWHGPAAVLIDASTASCAEVFGYFAHQAGALLVGEPSRGVMNSGVYFYPLPDHGVMSVTSLRAYDLGGNPLPDHLQPDLPVTPDLEALTVRGEDRQLQAALAALQGRLGTAVRQP